MPIYDFRCPRCDARFERMVPVGTESAPCPECGAERTERVLMAPLPPMKLVKSRSSQRAQEVRNAGLQRQAKDRFKKSIKKVHDQHGGRPKPPADRS